MLKDLFKKDPTYMCDNCGKRAKGLRKLVVTARHGSKQVVSFLCDDCNTIISKADTQ